jgi:hypothetical protein
MLEWPIGTLCEARQSLPSDTSAAWERSPGAVLKVAGSAAL